MSQKTTNLPGSNDQQGNSKHSRNHDAHDTGGNRPNMEQVMYTENKSKQGPEDDHTAHKSKDELADERGGHGHSGHSGNRNGSRKKQ